MHLLGDPSTEKSWLKVRVDFLPPARHTDPPTYSSGITHHGSLLPLIAELQASPTGSATALGRGRDRVVVVLKAAKGS